MNTSFKRDRVGRRGGSSTHPASTSHPEASAAAAPGDVSGSVARSCSTETDLAEFASEECTSEEFPSEVPSQPRDSDVTLITRDTIPTSSVAPTRHRTDTDLAEFPSEDASTALVPYRMTARGRRLRAWQPATAAALSVLVVAAMVWIAQLSERNHTDGLAGTSTSGERLRLAPYDADGRADSAALRGAARAALGTNRVPTAAQRAADPHHALGLNGRIAATDNSPPGPNAASALEPDHEGETVRTVDGSAEIPAGTAVPLSLETPIGINSRPGDPVRARVRRDVLVGDRVIIPSGSIVVGRIVATEGGQSRWVSALKVWNLGTARTVAMRFTNLRMPETTVQSYSIRTALVRVRAKAPSRKIAVPAALATVGAAIIAGPAGAVGGGFVATAVAGAIGSTTQFRRGTLLSAKILDAVQLR